MRYLKQIAASNAFHLLHKDADVVLLHLSGDVGHGETVQELVLKPRQNALQRHQGTVKTLRCKIQMLTASE